MTKATIRSEFKIPTGIICHCDGAMRPCAHSIGDGWTWGLECEVCASWWGDEAGKDAPIMWPFIEDSATADDFRAAGFEVV